MNRVSVRQIVEEETAEFRADSDPRIRPERPPAGFVATRDDETAEWRFDQQYYGYRFSKWWTDPYTHKQREARNLSFKQFHDPYGSRSQPLAARAKQFIEAEARKFTEAGWDVKML